MDLHVDLIIEIISHLPVKSLVRFQSVCKTWNSIINNQQFITKHSKNQNSKNVSRCLFVQKRPDNLGTKISLPISTLGYDCDNKAKISNYYHQDFNRHQISRSRGTFPTFTNVYIMGPCSGVVCVVAQIKEVMDVILWNLSTRKLKTLINHSIGFNRTPCIEGLGFGFDPMSKEFKVIALWKRSRGKINVDIYYTSKNYSITHEYPDDLIGPFNIFRYFYGLVLNESCCWLAIGSGINRMSLLSFDMSEEVFKNTSLPPEVESSYVTPQILAFGDAIALIAPQCNKLTGSSFVIWTRKDLTECGSWTKIANINLISGNYRALAFWRNCEYLILENADNDEVVSYNIDLQETKKMEIDKMRLRDHWLFEYTDTLVPVL